MRALEAWLVQRGGLKPEEIQRLTDERIVALYFLPWDKGATTETPISPQKFLLERVKERYGYDDDEAREHIRQVRARLKGK